MLDLLVTIKVNNSSSTLKKTSTTSYFFWLLVTSLRDLEKKKVGVITLPKGFLIYIEGLENTYLLPTVPKGPTLGCPRNSGSMLSKLVITYRTYK